jgi:outer membrane lipoprotein-sorting protein
VTIVVNDKDVSSGKFYYMRRGKEPRLRLELSKPAVQQLVIENGKLQLYQPSLKQVQETMIGEHKDKVEMIMALGFGQSSADLKKNFTVSLAGEETLDGKKTTVLELKPKDSRMFSSIRMWMDQQKWTSVQVKTTESGGDYMIFKFSNVKLNGSIPDSAFRLNLPKDVHVIKM